MKNLLMMLIFSRTFFLFTLGVILRMFLNYNGVVGDSSFPVDMEEETNEERHERRYKPDERMNE